MDADKARLEAFLDAVPGEYCGFAPDGTVIYSDGLCRLLGVASVRTLSDLQAALNPADAAILEGLFQTLQEQGHDFTLNMRGSDSAKIYRVAGRRGRDRSELTRFAILWIEDATNVQQAMDRAQAAHDTAAQAARPVAGRV